jgi:hypothetical protein
MNNYVLAGLAAVAGYTGWKVYRSGKEKEMATSFLILLNDDDKQVIADNKVDLIQTAQNLTAMYFRNNKAELTSTSDLLKGKGYVKTANILAQHAAGLTSAGAVAAITGASVGV